VKTRLGATAFAAVAMLALSACASGTGTGAQADVTEVVTDTAVVTDHATEAASPQASAGEDQTVTVWQLTMQPTQREAWDALVSGFEAEHPNITVVTEERATDPHKDALRQSAGTGTGPDIYRYWGGYGLGGQLVQVGLSEDITNFYNEFGWADELTPAALENATQYGGHHGVPFLQATQAIYYNKALFEQAGITEIPTTYDELVAAARQLRDAGITPMTFGGTVNWHVMRLLDNLIETKCGAELADELNKGDADWGTTPCVTEAFTELQMWGDEFLNPGFMGINNDDAAQLFYNGQAAMTLEGDWFGPMALDGGMEPGSFGIFPFPTGTGRAYGFGELMYITPDSQVQDAAAKFLDYMLSPAGQEKLGNAFSTLSVNPNVEPPAGAVLVPEWQELIANSNGLFTNNDQNFSTAETSEYWRIMNSVLTGQMTPAEAGAAFQTWKAANS